MNKSFFPPYFVEVSLAWALGVMPLVCGLTTWSAANTAAENAQQTSATTRSIVLVADAQNMSEAEAEATVDQVEGSNEDVSEAEAQVETTEEEAGAAEAQAETTNEESGAEEDLVGVSDEDVAKESQVEILDEEATEADTNIGFSDVEIALSKAQKDFSQKQVVKGDALAHKIVIKGSPLTKAELELNLGQFVEAVSSVEASGYRVGILIYDLGTNASISYAASEVFYPASSAKGPYVISVYEDMVDTGFITTSEVSRLVEPTIVNSDNDSYRALHRLCGSKVFADWAVKCGAIKRKSDDYKQFATLYYPHMSARQMSLMWRHAFDYLSSGSDSAKELIELFERRQESPLRAGLPEDDLTITKAGWYPSDSGKNYEATADAGIVFEDGHAYVTVIMTDIPDNLDRLTELVPGIWSAISVLG